MFQAGVSNLLSNAETMSNSEDEEEADEDGDEEADETIKEKPYYKPTTNINQEESTKDSRLGISAKDKLQKRQYNKSNNFYALLRAFFKNKLYKNFKIILFKDLGKDKLYK